MTAAHVPTMTDATPGPVPGARRRLPALVGFAAAALAFVGCFLPYFVVRGSVRATWLLFSVDVDVSQFTAPTPTAWQAQYAWCGGLAILLGGVTLLATPLAGGRGVTAWVAGAATLLGWITVLAIGLAGPPLAKSAIVARGGGVTVHGIDLSQVGVTVDTGSIEIAHGAGWWVTLVFGLIALACAVCTCRTAGTTRVRRRP
jgi:hypothetical protein